MLQGCYRGVTEVLQRCYSGVTVVLQARSESESEAMLTLASCVSQYVRE
jgi:hypothetical protein